MNPSEYEIIDAHIHPALEKAHDSSWFAPAGTSGSMVEALKRAGINRACGSVIAIKNKPAKFEDITALNNAALKFRDDFPEFFIPGIHVMPEMPEESCRELERCRDAGVRWVGELVGYIFGYPKYATRKGLDVFAEAGKLGMTVNFHCSDLPDIRELCEKCPNTKFVLAHPQSSKREYLERIALVAEYDNLYQDLAGSGLMRRGLVAHALETAGEHKILFGTDYPICNPANYVYGVLYEDLSREQREAVFSGNFLKLIG